MKIILAPDKFKGSLSAHEFCEVVEKCIGATVPSVEIIKLPLADGGDGTIEVINYYLKGKIVSCKVNDPFFRPVRASYLYAEELETAFIEMAEASGIKLLKENELDCKSATTFGTGELIKDAMNRGARKIILGIGGSATNDCGIGMATALGYRFLDKNGREVDPIGKQLSEIVAIDDNNVDSRLSDIQVKIACDVTNPLYGKNGAAYVYAKQKGASDEDIELLDQGLEHFSQIIQTKFDVDPQQVEGAGAAGGMGIASKLFLGGELNSGIDLVMQLADFDEIISDADWIITGEGKLDTQTLSGKTMKGVVQKAKDHSIKVAVFCGANELDTKELDELGITYIDTLMNHAENLNDALTNSQRLLSKIAEDFGQNILNAKN